MTIRELSEGELKKVKNDLYNDSKEGKREFKNLLELICCRENIIHAIRKVKSNSGFKTEGVDDMKGQEFLNLNAEEAFEIIKTELNNYRPKKVRRVMIPKSNGKERPLGISTIIDRVVQTCIANIIEPILEGQFFEHSYGFRPTRRIEHAIARYSTLCTNNKRHWVVEGDIKGYFDNIDHKILINKLYKMGIRDKRVLELIKKTLKAGIKGVKDVNEIGTPQGSTISTILANVYLNDFDHWISKQWENQTFVKLKKKSSGWERLRSKSNLKEGYLIRYADDWVILTDSEENAIRWKKVCRTYLKEKLKIELSEEKTKITDTRKQAITFVGIDFFKIDNGKGNFTLRTAPNMARLREKKTKLSKKLKEIRRASRISENAMACKILEYNAVVRGLNNFYKHTTLYSTVLTNIEWRMKNERILTKNCRNGYFTTVNECKNLEADKKRMGRNRTIAWKLDNVTMGLAKLGGGKFIIPKTKAQWVNKYDLEAMQRYNEITNSKSKETINRNPYLTLDNIPSLIAKNSETIYTLEYFINRPMVFNRDKGKCKECKVNLTGYGDTDIHHINPKLEYDKRNKVTNLVTLCKNCHIEIHRIKRQEKQKIHKSRKKNTNTKPIRKNKKPDKETLTKLVTTKNYTAIGRIYGVAGNTVKRWAISEGLHELRIHKKSIRS